MNNAAKDLLTENVLLRNDLKRANDEITNLKVQQINLKSTENEKTMQDYIEIVVMLYEIGQALNNAIDHVKKLMEKEGVQCPCVKDISQEKS